MYPFTDENGFHDGIMKVEIMNGLDKIKFAQQIAASLDFIIYRNTNFQSTFYYRRDTGDPYDLTGATADLTAVHSIDKDLTFKINIKIAEPTNGKIELSLSKEEIQEIPFLNEDSYWNYTLTLKSVNGIIYRILQGIIKIEV